MFDEPYAEKEECYACEFDNRRQPQSEGNLEQVVPVVIDELSFENGTYDLERKLYDTPIIAPTNENASSRGEIDGDVRSENKVDVKCTNKIINPGGRRDGIRNPSS